MSDSQPAVKSPCIGVCALDVHDVCIGCYRSAGEIAAWSSLDDDGKRAVLTRADRRYREAWGEGITPA